mgnify:FL=1
MRDGTKNLKPVRTTEEAKKRGRNGGIASGKARREKADLKKLLNIALTMPIKDEGQAGKVKALEELGSLKDIGSTNVTGSTALIARIMQGALSGDPRMLRMALDLSGALEPTAEDVEAVSDGFIEALDKTAAEDWADEKDS